MCRRYSGPRCSYDATNRLATATRHLTNVLEEDKALKAEARRGNNDARKRLASARHRTKLANAKNRLSFAEKHFYTTPAGFEDLESKVAAAQNAKDAASYLKELEASRARRRQAYKDLRLGGKEQDYLNSERSVVRALSTMTDGKTKYSKSGIPGVAFQEINEVLGSLSKEEREQFVNERLATWEASDYARAPEWDEDGRRYTWSNTSRARPKKSAGTRLETISRLQRMNMPDGQVVESRADIHLAEKDGQYVVASRLTVAASWEDTSPIHRLNTPLGQYITADRGVARNDGYSETVFATKAEAEAAIKRIRRNFTSAQQSINAAQIARASHVRNLKQAAGFPERNVLSKFGTELWPRYNVPTGEDE